MRWVFVGPGGTGGKMFKHLREEVDLFDRHLMILGYVVADGPIGIVNLADRTGYTRYQVRYSLRLLEEHGIIEPTPDGAIPGDRAQAFLDSYRADIGRVLDRLTELRLDDVSVPAE